MTEKLKVSREVADAIEYLRTTVADEAIMKDHADTVVNNSPWAKKCAPLNKISLLDMASMLTNGYEVEMTSHERIMKAYNAAKRTKNGSFARTNDATYCYHSGVMTGITTALDTLGIKIKGVNDK